MHQLVPATCVRLCSNLLLLSPQFLLLSLLCLSQFLILSMFFFFLCTFMDGSASVKKREEIPRSYISTFLPAAPQSTAG